MSHLLSKTFILEQVINLFSPSSSSSSSSSNLRAQVLQLDTLRHGSSSRVALQCILSDAVHSIPAKLSPQALAAFQRDAQGRGIDVINGGIIALNKFDVVTSPDFQHFEFIVDEFVFLGGSGSNIIGTPNPVQNVPQAAKLIMLLARPSYSDERKSEHEHEFVLAEYYDRFAPFIKVPDVQRKLLARKAQEMGWINYRDYQSSSSSANDELHSGLGYAEDETEFKSVAFSNRFSTQNEYEDEEESDLGLQSLPSSNEDEGILSQGFSQIKQLSKTSTDQFYTQVERIYQEDEEVNRNALPQSPPRTVKESLPMKQSPRKRLMPIETARFPSRSPKKMSNLQQKRQQEQNRIETIPEAESSEIDVVSYLEDLLQQDLHTLCETYMNKFIRTEFSKPIDPLSWMRIVPLCEIEIEETADSNSSKSKPSKK
jgi:hypothetical protein